MVAYGAVAARVTEVHLMESESLSKQLSMAENSLLSIAFLEEQSRKQNILVEAHEIESFTLREELKLRYRFA